MTCGFQFLRKLVRLALRPRTGNLPNKKGIVMKPPSYVPMNGWHEAWGRYMEAAVSSWPLGLLTGESRFELDMLTGPEEELQYPIIGATQPARARRTHARPSKPLTYDELPHVPNLPPISAASRLTLADAAPVGTSGPVDKPMQCHRDWNASRKASWHSIQNETDKSAHSAPIEELLTAHDCGELLEMHILPPGSAEEQRYISLHPSADRFPEVSMKCDSNDERAMDVLTADDCRQLREMRIIPPGWPEEQEYMLLHPPARIADSGELCA